MHPCVPGKLGRSSAKHLDVQGCAVQIVQDMDAEDSHTTQPPQTAVAAAAQAALAGTATALTAAATIDVVHLQRRSKRSRHQQLQQEDMLGDDAGSGSETAPQAQRKRSAPDSMLQPADTKRAKGDCKGAEQEAARGMEPHASSGGEGGVSSMAMDGNSAVSIRQRVRRKGKRPARYE